MNENPEYAKLIYNIIQKNGIIAQKKTHSTGSKNKKNRFTSNAAIKNQMKSLAMMLCIFLIICLNR